MTGEHEQRGGTPHRRAWDTLLPLLFGIVVGLLTTFAGVSGRLSALETTVVVHGKALDKLPESIQELQRSTSALTVEVQQLRSARRP